MVNIFARSSKRHHVGMRVLGSKSGKRCKTRSKGCRKCGCRGKKPKRKPSPRSRTVLSGGASGCKYRTPRKMNGGGGDHSHGHGQGHGHRSLKGGYQCRRPAQTGGYQCRRPAQTGGDCGKCKHNGQHGGNINGKPLTGGGRYQISGSNIMKGGKCKPNHIHPMRGGRLGPAVSPIGKRV